jgi:hypothetical protein
MSAWAVSPAWDRGARHVCRSRLRVAPGSPQHSLTFLMQEALRLASLPGENEGRVYYFRQVCVTGLLGCDDRAAWLEGFQHSLADLATRAVHGADPGSNSSDAVFFQNGAEALEILLQRLVDRREIGEWFWPLLTGRGQESPDIPGVIDLLRDSPASWLAVAAAIFASGRLEPVPLLAAIPTARAQAWLQDLDGSQAEPPAPAAPCWSSQAREAVGQSLRVFGPQDSRVLWLATLATLLTSPGDLATGTTVWRARFALRQLVLGNSSQLPQAGIEDSAAASTTTDSRISSAADERADETAARAPIEESRAPIGPGKDLGDQANIRMAEDEPESGQTPWPSGLEKPERSDETQDGFTAGTPRGAPETARAMLGPHPSATRNTEVAGAAPGSGAGPASQTHCAGLPTLAAGLFFLLNVLQRIELPRALSSGLAWEHPDFAPRLLARLAAYARVREDDPALCWIHSLIVTPTDSTSPVSASAWWPANLRCSERVVFLDGLLRIWAVAARRWCWRAAKIRANDVVTRAGIFSANRTDVDVSLPLDTADIRIRRAGLDLDPGWLPWFGRVVRFHYASRSNPHE